MACARKPESDIYLYRSVFGLYVCSGCLLNKGKEITFSSPEKVIDHLNEHINAGHHIPKRVFDRLKQDKEMNND